MVSLMDLHIFQEELHFNKWQTLHHLAIEPQSCQSPLQDTTDMDISKRIP